MPLGPGARYSEPEPRQETKPEPPAEPQQDPESDDEAEVMVIEEEEPIRRFFRKDES